MNKFVKSILKYLQIKAFNPYLKYMNFLSHLRGGNAITMRQHHTSCSLSPWHIIRLFSSESK